MSEAGYGLDRDIDAEKKKEEFISKNTVKYKCRSCGNVIEELDVDEYLHMVTGTYSIYMHNKFPKLDIKDTSLVARCVKCNAIITTNKGAYTNIIKMMPLFEGEEAEVDVVE